MFGNAKNLKNNDLDLNALWLAWRNSVLRSKDYVAQ